MLRTRSKLRSSLNAQCLRIATLALRVACSRWRSLRFIAPPEPDRRFALVGSENQPIASVHGKVR